jgi:hypothetical protein
VCILLSSTYDGSSTLMEGVRRSVRRIKEYSHNFYHTLEGGIFSWLCTSLSRPISQREDFRTHRFYLYVLRIYREMFNGVCQGSNPELLILAWLAISTMPSQPYHYVCIYRVSQKVVAKLNMLVCHIMLNNIYIGTCVQKCKQRPLEGDVRRLICPNLCKEGCRKRC